MSQKYEWLYNTTYPDKVQEFTEKLNITPNDATLIKQIQALIEQKKFAEANELRKQIPNYKQKEIIAQDWNTMADTVVALQLEYDSRYTPSYVLSKEQPTNQSEGDYWFQITNVEYIGETEEIGTGDKSPSNPYQLKGVSVPNTDIILYGLSDEIYDNYEENNKVLTRRIGKYILNGSEEWSTINDTKGTQYFTFNLNNNKDTICITNMYQFKNGWEIADITQSCFFNTEVSNNLIIKDTSKTLETFKQMLSETNLVVLYELITPKIIQL